MLCTIKRGDVDGEREVLIAVIRTIGVSATAGMIECDKQATIEFAKGEREIENKAADAIIDAFLRLKDE